MLISLLSCRVSKRNEKREIESSKPLITAGMSSVTGQPGWIRVYWSVHNRADYPYRCNYIELTRPWFTIGLRDRYAHQPPPKEQPWKGGGPLLDPLPIPEATKKIPMNFSIARAGAEGRHESSAYWDTIYVYILPRTFLQRVFPSSKVFSMRVSLSSIEAIERESFFTVKRTITDEAETESKRSPD